MHSRNYGKIRQKAKSLGLIAQHPRFDHKWYFSKWDVDGEHLPVSPENGLDDDDAYCWLQEYQVKEVERKIEELI